jgi:hypothetical protein
MKETDSEDKQKMLLLLILLRCRVTSDLLHSWIRNLRKYGLSIQTGLLQGIHTCINRTLCSITRLYCKIANPLIHSTCTTYTSGWLSLPLILERNSVCWLEFSPNLHAENHWSESYDAKMLPTELMAWTCSLPCRNHITTRDHLFIVLKNITWSGW